MLAVLHFAYQCTVAINVEVVLVQTGLDSGSISMPFARGGCARVILCHVNGACMFISAL